MEALQIEQRDIHASFVHWACLEKSVTLSHLDSPSRIARVADTFHTSFMGLTTLGDANICTLLCQGRPCAGGSCMTGHQLMLDSSSQNLAVESCTRASKSKADCKLELARMDFRKDVAC